MIFSDARPGARAAFTTALGLLCACIAPWGTVQAESPPEPLPESTEIPFVAIEHVTILPMTGEDDLIEDGTVVWRGERIVTVAESNKLDIPDGARRIDGRGKFLMPALADMHVHIPNDGLWRRMTGSEPPPEGIFRTADVLLPYVANGVLQVFNLSSDALTLAQRNAVESGRVLGPHIAVAVMVDGDPPINPGMARVAANPEAGRRIVAEIDAAGYDAVKTYTNLDFETFSAIVDEAKVRELPVLGHLPLRRANRTGELLVPGFMVAHAEEFGYQPPAVTVDAVPRLAELAQANRVWLISTLKLNEHVVEMTLKDPALQARPELRYVHPLIRQQWFGNNRYAQSADKLPRRKAITRFNPVLLRAFADKNIPIVVGTDSIVAGTIPGFGLHDELEALSEAGLPNRLILKGATRLPAEWLGVADDRGSIEEGKGADLLLLDADPLEDVGNTRRISMVISDGRILLREELDTLMKALAERYAAWPAVDVPPVVQDKSGLDDE